MKASSPFDAGPHPRQPRGSRIATAALLVAFVGVLSGLTAADRAFLRAADEEAQLAAIRAVVQLHPDLRARLGDVDTISAAGARARLAAADTADGGASVRRLPSRLRLVIWGSG